MWSLQSSAWRKGHLHAPLKRKVQPWKSQGSCGTDLRSVGKAVQQTQECSWRCHTGGGGEGSPGLGGRREHWQSWRGEPWAGCRSKQRSAGLKGLHTAPDYLISDSSLCFQLLASINITTPELEKQQKFLQRSPHPLWVLNIFQVQKSSLDQLLFWISQGRRQEPGGTEEEYQLTAWILPVLHMTSLRACLTLHKREIADCLFTAPLPVSHIAFASCLTNVADQVKLELPDSKTWHPWVQTPLLGQQLIAHSRTTPFSYHPWGHWPNAMVGRDTESAKHF